jgi:hypothetical protein
MNKPRWIETRKECEIGENGELVTKKVTLELEKNKVLEKKDLIDISLRFVSLLAIFIPIVLFFQQQKAERDKQKALFQLDVYGNVTSKLHAMADMPISGKQFEVSRNELFYNIYPRLKLLNDKPLTDTFAKIKDIINFTYGLSTVFNAADSLNECLVQLGENREKHFQSTNVQNLPAYELDQYRWFDKLANGGARIRNWNFETPEVKSFCRKYQQLAMGYVTNLQMLADKIIYSRIPEGEETQVEEFKRLDEEGRNLNEFVSLKNVMDDFGSKYDSTYRSYLQQRTLMLDSLMTSSSSYFYNQ